MKIYHFILIFSLYLFSFSKVSDSTETKQKTLISKDSARIISPPHQTILNKQKIRYAINPLCSVTQVVLLVNHYPAQVDTLGTFFKPPFEVFWDNSSLSDQDQIHLQFSYILFHPQGDTIISAPTPHHWIINRTINHSKKRCYAYQVLEEEDIVVDGNSNEWPTKGWKNLAGNGSFRCGWTGISFFLCVKVYDPLVTVYDRVEVCFDMKQTRDPFLKKEHRILSFCPKTISFAWAVDMTDSGSQVMDSVLFRLNEEVRWRSSLSDAGYTIEACVPLYLLSDLQFPNRRFGFDISVVNTNHKGLQESQVTSWSGANPAERHSPENWGTIKLRQAFIPLKIALFLGLSLILLVIVVIAFLLIISYKRNRSFEKSEERLPSPQLQNLLNQIEKSLTQRGLSIETVAQATGLSSENIELLLQKERETTFSQLLQLLRIAKAKELLTQDNMTIDRVVSETGFASQKEFEEIFSRIAGVSPEQWQKNRLEEQAEENEEEED